MVKPFKYFRKQAEKSEAAARSVSDDEISQEFRAIACAYRSQAKILKAKQKRNKRHRASKR